MKRRFFTGWHHANAGASPSTRASKPQRFVPEFEPLETRWLMSWSATGLQRLTDFPQATTVPFGTAEVLPNTGAIRVVQPLDFDKSPGTAVGGNPYLVYLSETASPQPILEAVVASDPGDAVPTSIQVQLTWNGGAPQSSVTFSTTGHSAGDDYLVAAQVNSAVSSTGAFSWSLAITVNLSGGGTANLNVNGTAYVVSNTTNDPFSSGWSLAGLDKLVSVSGGVLRVYGAGGVRFFA